MLEYQQLLQKYTSPGIHQLREGGADAIAIHHREPVVPSARRISTRTSPRRRRTTTSRSRRRLMREGVWARRGWESRLAWWYQHGQSQWWKVSNSRLKEVLAWDNSC